MRPSVLAWALGGALVGLLLAVLLLVLTRLLGGAPASPAPVLTVIPLPTHTPTPTATPTSTPAPEPTETPPRGSGGPGDFAPGQLVTIAGTGGEGLRLREAPGLDAAVRLVALESEVFEVLDGPVSADGYNWWHLTNPYDPSVQGWGADAFLQELEQ